MSSWSSALVVRSKTLVDGTCRVGQNHVYTVYIRYFWQGNHRIYGHTQRVYTVLANPASEHSSAERDCMPLRMQKACSLKAACAVQKGP